MVYKKYIKRGGKIYGPYRYHSKKVNGKVLTDYLGKEGVKSKKNKILKKNKTLIFSIIGILLLFSLVFFILNYKNITGLVISEEIVNNQSENENNLAFIKFVIELTKAEHLDANRQFISDIYNEVKALDDIWSKTINNNEYVRVTFEENLTSKKDITIYPRIVDGTPKIEVYEANKNEIIAEFTNIISNEYNKVLLTNLSQRDDSGEPQRTQDVFDLLILGGSLEFEHIVDPINDYYVDSFDSSSTAWTPTGDSPYLNTQDEPTNYISAGGKNINHGDFGFPNLPAGATSINSVTFYIYADCGSELISVFLWDSGASVYVQHSLGTCGAYSWNNFAATELTTVDEVNNAKFYVRSVGSGAWTGTVAADAAYLKVDYEEPAAPDNSPTTTLNAPADYYNSTASNVTFNGTGTDDNNLVNVSLYLNTTGSWKFNATNSTPAVNNTPVIFYELISDGVYLWNIYSCDNASTTQCVFAAANRTFTVDSTPPYFTALVNQTSYDNTSLSYDINAADDIKGLGSFSIDDTTNFSIVASTGVITNITTLVEYYYIVNVSVNDTLGNLNWSFWSLNVTAVPIPPTASFETNPANLNESNSQSITFELSCSDNSAVDYLILYGNWTGTWHANQTNSSPINATTWSIKVNGIPEGNRHVWGVWCNDSSDDDWTDTNRTFTVDLTAPTITLHSYTNATQKKSSDKLLYNISVIDAGVGASYCEVGVNTASAGNVTVAVSGGWCNGTYDLTGASDGNQTINAYANDTLSNTALNDSYVVWIDNTGPTINTEGANETEISQNEWFCLNITATDSASGVGTVYAEVWNTTHWVNYTMSEDETSCDGTASDGIYGVEIQGTAQGTWNYSKAHANDTLNNWNSYDFSDKTINVTAPSDTYYPQFSGFAENPGNNSNYSYGQSYQFNSTITYTNATVYLSFDGTNYSASNISDEFYIDFDSLSAGTYNYYWWSYGNGSQNNYNSSNTKAYVVQKINPAASLMNNDSWTITYPKTVKINYSESNNGDKDFIYTVYRNGVNKSSGETITLGYGTYNYVLNTTGGANYTANSSIDAETFTVQQNTGSCSVLFNESSGITYGISFLVWTNCTSDFVLYRNGTTISNNSEQNLAASAYNFTVIRNDTTNYSNHYNEQTFTVQQATGVVYAWIDNQQSNKSVLLYSKKWLNATLETGVGDIELWYNNTLINQGASPANLTNFTSEGEFNVSGIYSGNENYTSDIETWWVTVSTDSAPTVTIIYPENIIYNVNVSVLNYTVNDDISLSHCWYSLNEGGTNSSASTTCSNHTDLISTEGSNTWTVYANDSIGQENADSVTFTKDTTYPTVSITYPQNTNYTLNVSELNYTYTETNADKCWWSNNSGTWNSSVQTCGTNWTGLTSVEGSNTWTVYINDTAGNENSTSITFTKDTAYPSVTINSPLNQNYSTKTITFNATATDSGGISSCWYSLSAGITNNSLTNSAGDYYIDTNSSMNQGSHTVKYYCNDSSGNLNDTEQVTFFIDSVYPSITSLTESPNDGANYSEETTYEFNATITDTNLDKVLIEFDGTNYTATNSTADVYNFTITNLSAGTYNYKWFANDTSNNINLTAIYDYTVNNATGNITLWINDSASNQSAPYGTQTNASATTLYGTVILYRNSTVVTSTNNNFRALGVGYYNYTAFSPGDENHSSASITRFVEITQIQSEVNLTLNGTDTNTTINQYSTIWLNGTLITGDSSATLKLYNESLSINQGASPLNNYTTFSQIGVFNITIFYTESQNYTGSSETWWLNVTQAPDTTNPEVTSLTESPNDPANYSEETTYEFNATITDSGVGLHIVLLDFNGTNYTATTLGGGIYNFTITNLTAGTYSYRWWANDTSSNINNSENRTYTVSQATPSLNITFSPSNNESYGTQTTITGINCPSQLNCSLYRNDTGGVTTPDIATLGIGAYNYTYNTTGNVNYTSKSFSNNLTIYQNTGSCSVLFNESSDISYGISFLVWTNCTSNFVLYRNGTTISNNSEQSLGVNLYNFTVIRNDTINYSNHYNEQTFTVQQATSEVNLTLNITDGNISINQYGTIWLNATLITGQSGENITLYNNGTRINDSATEVSNLTQFNSTGSYNITTFYSGNANYTSAYETWWVNVTEKDLTKPNISIIYPTNNTNTTNANIHVNYTVSDNKAVGFCWYSNSSGQYNYSITSCANLTTQTWEQGNNTIIIYVNDSSGNENSSSVTFSVDSIDPTIQFTSPTETSGTSLGRNYIEVNVTASDDNLDTITIRLYKSTSLVQTNTSSTSPFHINYTGLSAGTYYFNATANDTLNNKNSTETKNIILVLPSLTIIRPENETYLSKKNLLLNYSAEYEDFVWYNIDLGSNSTITGNTTFDTSKGQHTLYLYANNSIGTTGKNVTFTVNLTKFTILGSEYNGSTKGNSTNFDKYSYTEIQNLSNIILEHTSHGKISFNQAINLTNDANLNDNQADLDTNIDISNNKIEINSAALTNFNKNATLYFYGLSLSNPRALKDTDACPSTICTTPVSSAGIWSFNVTGFTIYSLEETPAGATTTTPGGASGGGSSYAYKCSNNSDCEGKDEICWNGKCVKLFDIKIIDFESPVKLGDFFHFTYLIKGMADISDDVEVQFWIEKNGEKVTSGSDTIYLGNFEEKIETTKIFFPSDVESGTYVFYVQVVHQAYQAKSHRTIQIEVKEGFAKIISEPKDFKTYVICALIVLIVFILFFIFYLERKKIKKKFMQEEKWIKKHKVLLLVLSLFIVLIILVCYLNLFELISNLVFKAISWIKINIASSYFYYGLGVIFTLVILVSLTIIIKKKKLSGMFKAWRSKTKNRIFLKKRKADELLKEKYKSEAKKSEREFKRVSKMSDRLGKKLKNCLIKSERGIKLLINFLKKNIVLFIGLIKKHRREEKKEIRLMRKLYKKKRKGELIERRKEKKKIALIKSLSRKKRRKELIKRKKERKKELIKKKREEKEELKKRKREKEKTKKKLQNFVQKTGIQIKRTAQFFVRKTKEVKSNLKDIKKYSREKRKESLEKKKELQRNKKIIKKREQIFKKKKELIEKEKTKKKLQNLVQKTGIQIKRTAQFFVRKTKEVKSNLKDIKKYSGEKRKESLEKKKELQRNKEVIKKREQIFKKKKELIEKGKKILEEAKRFEKRKVEKIRGKIKFQNIVNKYKIQIKKIKRILKESIKKISKIDIKKTINKFPKIKLPKRHLPKPIIEPKKSLEEEEKLKIPEKEKDRIKRKRESLKNAKKQIKQIYKNTFKFLKKILRRKSKKKIINGFEKNLIKTGKYTQQHLKALKNIVSTKADFEKKQLQIGFEKDKLNFQNKINKIRRNTRILINKLTGHLNDLISLKKRKRIKTKEPEKRTIKGQKLIKDFFSKGVTKKPTDKPTEQLTEEVEKEKKKRINLAKIGNKFKEGVTKTSGKIFNYTKSFSSKKINKIRNRLKERAKLKERHKLKTKPESAEQLIEGIKAEDKKKRRVNKLKEFIKKIKEKIFISPREREKQKNLKLMKEMFEEED